MNIAVLCPTHPGMHPVLLGNQIKLLQAGKQFAREKHVAVHCFVDDWVPEWKTPIRTHVQRATHIASVRNALILRLAAERASMHEEAGKLTHVIWMDADVVRYDASLFYDLAVTSEQYNAVTAPMVFLDPGSDRNMPHGRWYDTAGFIHHGERTDLWRPWFKDAPRDRPLPPLFEVDGSVGCVYCVPWRVYAEGASHHFCGEMFTEHYPVCQHARKMGMKLLVRTDTAVHHAYLPDYGEEFH